MHERAKLKEANHFLEQMHAGKGNPGAFKHELSAFMGAARSVLQYALKEAKGKAGGQQWYDQAKTNPLVLYFKNKRDTSIHERPVEPARKFETKAAGLLNIGDDDDEMMVPHSHIRIVERCEFRDWPGEEVTELAMQYLTALERLVEDGIAKGWITG